LGKMLLNVAITNGGLRVTGWCYGVGNTVGAFINWNFAV
jgi:hypothetical protein